MAGLSHGATPPCVLAIPLAEVWVPEPCRVQVARLNPPCPSLESTPTGAAEPEIPDTCSVLCRLGKPDDCAGIVSFLCSPDAGYITGENIVVAGFSPRL